ncbi:MAG TPA: OmpH family outer membrane protein [Stellaceae bacterium]|nr:OmpH family outer membrane protein [Stellaceae bacterium]
MRSMLRSRIGRALAGAVALLLAGPVLAQQAAPPPVPAPVILTVDMQQILKDAQAAKSAQGVINQQYASYSKQVAQQEDDLQKARADLERQRTILAPDAFNNRAKELQQRYDALSQVFQGKRQALQQSYNEAMLKVENMALEVVADIVKERKANLVLQKQAVLFEAEGLDITADAMARLDLKLPSVQVNVPKDDGEAAAGAAASGKKH